MGPPLRKWSESATKIKRHCVICGSGNRKLLWARDLGLAYWTRTWEWMMPTLPSPTRTEPVDPRLGFPIEIATEWREELLTNNNVLSFQSVHRASERIDGGV